MPTTMRVIQGRLAETLPSPRRGEGQGEGVHRTSAIEAGYQRFR